MNLPALLSGLDDPTSRLWAGIGSGASGTLAFVAESPLETLASLLVAILAPLAIAAVNRWIDRSGRETTLRVALAAAEQAAAELRAELARRDADAPPPSP